MCAGVCVQQTEVFRPSGRLGFVAELAGDAGSLLSQRSGLFSFSIRRDSQALAAIRRSGGVDAVVGGKDKVSVLLLDPHRRSYLSPNSTSLWQSRVLCWGERHPPLSTGALIDSSCNTLGYRQDSTQELARVPSPLIILSVSQSAQT